MDTHDLSLDVADLYDQAWQTWADENLEAAEAERLKTRLAWEREKHDRPVPARRHLRVVHEGRRP